MGPLVSNDFPLPQVSEALAPYIKTRQEALRIRRILALYLTSHIRSTDGEVPKVPIELSGLRKDYLKALQANIKARNEYKELTGDAVNAKNDDTRHLGPTSSRSVEDRAERLSTYLSLLQERRNYERLSILQDYLEILNKKDVAASDYLSIDRMQKELPPMPEAPSVALGNREELIAKLKDEHQTEKTQKDATSTESPSTGSGSGSKLAALCRTRDELIKWMEEQLAKSSQTNEDASPKDSDRKPEGEDRDMQQRKAAVAAKYEQYLEARKGMTAAASEITSNRGEREEGSEDQIVDPQIESGGKNNDRQASGILTYLTGYLIPSTRAQKDLLQQESHIATSLATQEQLTAQLFDRLTNESHLLPNYPLLSRQPRFKKSVAALGPRQLSTPLKESRSIYEARAWAFAADAARSAIHGVVEERLEHGFVHVENAEGVLDELRELLGSDGVDEGGRGESTHSDDVAIDDTTMSKRLPLKGKVGAQRTSKGIWSGLDGKVGLHSVEPVGSR